MTYNLCYFSEKESFLQELRANAIGQSKEYRDFVDGMTDIYADVLEAFRLYVDSDEATDRKAWKRFCKASQRLSLAVDQAYALLEEGEK